MEYTTCCQFLTYIFYTFVILVVLKILATVTKGKVTSSKRLDGQVIIITGASRGIGKCNALDLAKRGAKIIIACNNLEEANETRDEIIKKSGNKQIEAHFLDLGSFKSVRKFANHINATEKRLDVLINNAGIGISSDIKSEDGFTLALQVNHYGHFLLTNLLIDLLKKTAPSRIIHVSSLLHLLGILDFDNMKSGKGNITDFIRNNILTVYSNSKLYNVIGSNEFARRLKGTGVTSNCLYPGCVRTDLFENVFLPYRLSILAIAKFFFKTPEEGAQTSIHLAISDKVAQTSGKYFVDCMEMNFFNFLYSRQVREKFWEKSCDLVGLKPEERSI